MSMRDIPQMSIENEQASKQEGKQESRQALRGHSVGAMPCPIAGACSIVTPLRSLRPVHRIQMMPFYKYLRV